MKFADITDVLSIGKKTAAIVIGLSIPPLLYFKSDDIVDTGAHLAQRLSKAEIAGVKFEFNDALIEKSVGPILFQHLDPKAKRAIANDIASFEPRSVVRLLSVGLLDKTCDFETPTHEMAQDYAADVFLREKKLATLEFDDALRQSVQREIIQREASTHRKSDLGYPRACYNIKLTNHGMDVRTAMVHVFGSSFAQNADGGEPSPPKKLQEARR
jgi:hypothetical protein